MCQVDFSTLLAGMFCDPYAANTFYTSLFYHSFFLHRNSPTNPIATRASISHTVNYAKRSYSKKARRAARELPQATRARAEGTNAETRGQEASERSVRVVTVTRRNAEDGLAN